MAGERLRKRVDEMWAQKQREHGLPFGPITRAASEQTVESYIDDDIYIEDLKDNIDRYAYVLKSWICEHKNNPFHSRKSRNKSQRRRLRLLMYVAIPNMSYNNFRDGIFPRIQNWQATTDLWNRMYPNDSLAPSSLKVEFHSIKANSDLRELFFSEAGIIFAETTLYFIIHSDFPDLLISEDQRAFINEIRKIPKQSLEEIFTNNPELFRVFHKQMMVLLLMDNEITRVL